ncbi:GDP-L-fucose synthase family protein [Synechococcus sp. W4D4]|uniref:GDP-L-fucose synthase family protein n=1 Tax=Synechococcus sp. W4D4 TaxID=3392294 RepID=UPI0039EB9710
MGTLISSEDRIFIAGHRGMAGGAISRALQRAGYSKQLLFDRAALDLEDSSSVNAFFQAERPDVVVLAAAKVGGILANSTYPADFLLANLVIQTNVIRAAYECGARRLLFLGSSCIYPKLAEQPIREESLLTGSLEPTNEWYAVAKIAGLKLCHALRVQHGFDAISLMPTNLYGPGDNYHATDSHVVAALIRRFDEAVTAGSKSVRCWGSGAPLREFLHADDLGEASVFALENWFPVEGDPQFLNVGTGTDISIKELAEAVARATGFSGEIIWDASKPDGTPKKQLDVSRLASLGWTARIPLEEGLVSTVALFREQLKQQLVRL